MNAEAFVGQVKKLDLLIKNKLIEKEQWMAVATSTTAPNNGDKVQSSSNQQKMADAVHKILEIEKEIDEAIDHFIEVKQSVVKTIETLPPAEYDVIHMTYIQYMNMHDVALACDKSYSWVVEKRRSALIRLAKQMKGKK